MRPYTGNRHGEAEYNRFTAIPSGSVPSGATRPDGGDHFAQLVHVVNSISTSGSSTLSSLGPITNLNEVEATGAGASVDVSNYHNYTVHIISSAVTLGGTVIIENSMFGTDGTWAEVGSFVITDNEVNELSISNQAYRYIRTNVTARTDGKYSTYIYAVN